MNAWELPTSLNVAGVDYEIRTDYRVVLDVLTAMNDPDLFLEDATDREINIVRVEVLLDLLYVDADSIPPDALNEAIDKALSFIDMGIKDENKKSPRTMDWQQDAGIIIPAINRVVGTEVRSLPYMHWWTFMGAYMEIGKCLFTQIVDIRQKRAKKEKMEKWENQFYRENKKLIDLQNRTIEDQKAYEDLTSIF